MDGRMMMTMTMMMLVLVFVVTVTAEGGIVDGELSAAEKSLQFEAAFQGGSNAKNT